MIYVGLQTETVQSWRLKMRSQQALVLMTVSLDNSPISQSLLLGKINGTVVLKCHEVKFEISVALLTLICLLLFPSSFQWMNPRILKRGVSVGGRGKFFFSFFHTLISSLLFYVFLPQLSFSFFVLFVYLIITPSYLIPVSHKDILMVISPASSNGMFLVVILFYFYTIGLGLQ